MEGFVGKFGKHLENFKTTRKLLKKTGSLGAITGPEAAHIPEEEVHLRENISWQRGLTEALLNYSSKVASALETLESAHRDLVGAGLIGAGVDEEMLHDLSRGFAEATKIAKSKAKAVRKPLEERRGNLARWQETVAESDRTAGEFRHYAQKVSVLKKEHEDALRRGRQQMNEKFAACNEQQAVQRNILKHRDAERSATEAHAQSIKALQQAMSTGDVLSNAAQDVLYNTIEAIGRILSTKSIGPVTTPLVVTRADDNRVAEALVHGPIDAAAVPEGGNNGLLDASQPNVCRSLTPGYVRSLLTSPNLMESLCQTYFRRYDANSDGVIDFPEAVALVNDIQASLGVPEPARPAENQIRLLVERYSSAGGSALTNDQFPDWFKFALQASLAKSDANLAA